MRYDTFFRPSVHGYDFPNRWRDTVLGVLASRGRCGGMVFAALDAFLAGVPLSSRALEGRPAEMPAHDSAVARMIWRRQVESMTTGLGANLALFARFTYLPATASSGIAARTRRDLARIADALEAGRPVALGLVSALSLRHIARNHQVLAYAMDIDESRARISVYDPNLPLRDDVVLEVPLAAGGPVALRLRRSAKPYALWRGAFAEYYRAPRAEPVLPTGWWLGAAFIAVLLALISRRARHTGEPHGARGGRRGIL